jgi:hypothetical protein
MRQGCSGVGRTGHSGKERSSEKRQTPCLPEQGSEALTTALLALVRALARIAAEESLSSPAASGFDPTQQEEDR